LTVLVLLPGHSASAQAPPVPAAFQATYTELDNYLVNFNATLGSGNGSPYPTLMAGSLKASNSNSGPALLGSWNGVQLQNEVQLQLSALQAMGVQAIMVQVGFPVLNQSFLASQGQSYAAFLSYYEGVAQAVRAAGLKLIVENDTLITNSAAANWPGVGAFYQTLNWTAYQQARAQMAALIAQTLQPDYLVVMEEPGTETANTGQTNVSIPGDAAAMLSLMVAAVQQVGVPNLKIGAGVGAWQQNGLQFIQDYVALPVDFIDIHIYPVNNNNLPIALQMAGIAASAGKPVGMTECWMWKVADAELFQTVTSDQIRARDPFSFWAPLDALFLQTMQNLANQTQMLFIDPFNAALYFAYLPYGSAENLTGEQILNAENSAASAANQQAQFTSTGMSYYNSIVVPADTVPPSAPGGLNGQSANPTTSFLTWNAATDNVGVAGYNVFRNGQNVGVTASASYQDTGLTQAGTYSYTVEAFDLGGNLSSASQQINVTTADTSPPTVPGSVSATAVSAQAATVTWSPSTDNVAVNDYLVFCGTSAGNLVQVGRTGGAVTSYNSNDLSSGATYYYAVEAADKSGNVSTMSAIASVTLPMPPSAPQSLTATAASDSKVGLAWSAAAGGGLPVQNYHVYRGITSANLSQVAVVQQTSYNDTSVTATSTYYYAVAATDTGADFSAQSGVVAVAVPSAPTAPASLVATPNSASQVGLTWSAAASGGMPIQNYHVYRGTSSANLSQLAVTAQTSYNDTTVAAAATYYYAVAATDTGADCSPQSAVVTVAVPSTPTAPASLVATPNSATQVGLTWSAAASGGLPIQNYHVYRGTSSANLNQIAVTAQTFYNDSSVTAAATYYYAVAATDTGADLSPMSGTVTVAVPSAPTAPASLVATPNSASQVGLAWSAAGSGGLPIQNYHVYRGTSSANLNQIAVTAQTSYNDSSVTAAATYYYAVAATDVGGDFSPMSATVTVTVPSAPTAPANVAATPISASKTNLTWSASIGGGLPIQNYHVYRGTTSANLSQVAVLQQTCYNDTSVTAGTTYYYAVAATDTGGDVSPMSAIVTVTVP
jgi:fibronectin type 3 domain-containing protein